MSKVVFFIDGFNLYHALNHFAGGSDHFRYHKYKWNSLRKLANCYVTKKDSIEEILYFTTLAKWDAGKMARHKLYIRAQENEGVKVVYGKFKRKEKKCTVCQKYFWTREEKQTDVNIAVFLFQLAIEDINPSHKIGLKHIPDRSLLSVPVVCFLPLPSPAVGVLVDSLCLSFPSSAN